MKTRQILVGAIPIGGGARVSVQSMTNTKTSDIEKTCAQIDELSKAGCDIVRVSVPDMLSAKALTEIKKSTSVPLVADIHFDYKLALVSVLNGADKLRINPGNIGGTDKLRCIADCCREKGIPIRVGVNSGSLEKDILQKYGYGPEALARSALKNVRLLEEMGFFDICVSVKSSHVAETVRAYRMLAAETDCPLHIGVTEAGTEYMGIIKSSVAVGALLLDGIGDTIRVSLTADPTLEIKAGISILKAAGLRREGVDIISCPTCGRTQTDLISLIHEVEQRLQGIDIPITVAVMGCAVNGPGEARRADYGIACGNECGSVFKNGEICGEYKREQLSGALLELISKDKRLM